MADEHPHVPGEMALCAIDTFVFDRALGTHLHESSPEIRKGEVCVVIASVATPDKVIHDLYLLSQTGVMGWSINIYFDTLR